MLPNLTHLSHSPLDKGASDSPCIGCDLRLPGFGQRPALENVLIVLNRSTWESLSRFGGPGCDSHCVGGGGEVCGRVVVKGLVAGLGRIGADGVEAADSDPCRVGDVGAAPACIERFFDELGAVCAGFKELGLQLADGRSVRIEGPQF